MPITVFSPVTSVLEAQTKKPLVESMHAYAFQGTSDLGKPIDTGKISALYIVGTVRNRV
jgi:hypothetical protein